MLPEDHSLNQWLSSKGLLAQHKGDIPENGIKSCQGALKLYPE
jgi:hypothetical protein